MLKHFVVVVALLLVTACSKGRKVGDKVEVEWKGKPYPAVITQVYGDERYKIHYDGYGDEWDEIVGNSRILVAK